VSVTEHLGWGATVTTTEAVAGSIKAEQRRPQGRGEEGKIERRRGWERKKNWERQRIETHKTETNTSSEPRKPILIFSSSIAPCKPKKRRTQAANRDLHRHRNKRKTERGRLYTDKRKITVPQAFSQSPEAEKRRTQAASRDLHHHRNKRKTERGRLYADKSKITVPQAFSQYPEAGRPFSSSFHSCLKLCKL